MFGRSFMDMFLIAVLIGFLSLGLVCLGESILSKEPTIVSAGLPKFDSLMGKSGITFFRQLLVIGLIGELVFVLAVVMH
jgi:hypothetical protein